MSSYNIIYTSADKDTYLWSGDKFERFKSAGKENLYFSGKTFKHDELEQELKKCRQAVASLFNDKKPSVKPVEILIS